MPFDAEIKLPVQDPRTITTPRERLVYLRDFLLGLDPELFDMGDWPSSDEIHSCKTPACIGGWTDALFSPNAFMLSSESGALIGLTAEQSTQLFFPGGNMGNGERAIDSKTPTQAAAVLTHLIATGEVDWSVA